MFRLFNRSSSVAVRTGVTASLLALPVVVSTPAPSSTEITPTLSNTKAHHLPAGETGFKNPWDSFQIWDPSLLTVSGIKSIFHVYKDWKSHPIPDASLLPTARSPLDDNWGGGKLDELKITWLGHATFLVEFPAPQEEGKEKGTSIRGARVLFDPIFSHRCSPVQFMGPARVTPPPFPLKDLPEVDIVVISHNHYDHLDVQTLKHIYNSQPRGSVHFMVPLGNHDWFTSNGYAAGDVTELDWWEERDCSVSLPAKEGAGTIQTTLRVSCTPCQHFTGRSLTDRYHTLWASWAVSQPIQSNVLCKSHVWFGGDTGYKSVPRGTTDESGLPVCPAFKEIGDRLGPFSFSMIPIGAYDPRFAMSRVHCSPEDAVEVHCDVKSKQSVGGHYGTWVLTCEEMTEPPKRLKAAVAAKGLPADEFGVCDIGETIRVIV